MLAAVTSEGPPLTAREVYTDWWPLALSWLLMTAELPLTGAVITRLLLPEVNLAAWGVVFNLAILIQAPGTMLLAASTALVRDLSSYLRLRTITIAILATLTAVHALVAFTPLYDVVFRDILGLPPDVVAAARPAFMLALPWSAGTGSRRFFHGILIRYGHSRTVIAGNAVRFATALTIMGAGLLIGSVHGAVITAGALGAAVTAEAVFTWLRTRPVIARELLAKPDSGEPFTYRAFARFFLPLVATTLLALSVVTIISGALARLPGSLPSLAAWPVVFGFLHFFQSPGYGFQEVVISLLRRQDGVRVLSRVTWQIVVGMTVVLVLASVTPLAELWFRHGAGLSPELTVLATGTLMLGLLIPALRTLQSWLQGAIVFGGETRSMLESVVVFLLVTGAVLLAAMQTDRFLGIHAGMVAYVLGMAAQTAWLAWRARALLGTLGRYALTETGGRPA